MEYTATVDELRNILKYVSKGYKVPEIVYNVIYETAKKEVEDKHKVVLIKRDPNIHRNRIQAAYVKIIPGETMELHPCSVGGFGADFDGDSCYCYINTYTNLNNLSKNTIHISDFDKVYKCEIKDFKMKGNISITTYRVIDDVYCDAIDINTGDISIKKVSEWSIHTDLTLYSFTSDKYNIKDLLLSSDHSVVAFDISQNKIIRTTPQELIKNPKNYYLIRKKER